MRLVPKWRNLFNVGIELIILTATFLTLSFFVNYNQLLVIVIGGLIVFTILLLLCIKLITYNEIIFQKNRLIIVKGLRKKKKIEIPYSNIAKVYDRVYPRFPVLNSISIKLRNNTELIELYSTFFSEEVYTQIHKLLKNNLSKDIICFDKRFGV